MVNYFSRLIIILISVSVLLGICACSIEESYKEFNISNVTGYTIDDYIYSNTLDFARINDVTIIPEIKEIQHGEYVIYISAYSSVEAECAMIKNVTLSVEGKPFLEKELNTIIPMELNQYDIYEGYIDGGSFCDDLVDISNGQEMTLNIQLQVGEESEVVTKNISYEVFIKIYKSWVTPV